MSIMTVGLLPLDSLLAELTPLIYEAGELVMRVYATDFQVDKDGGGGFAHVFMHELGHTLGLDHGSINSFSVMSKVRRPSPSLAPPK